MQTEIIFNLRKNGGYRINGLGGRSFPVVRHAGRLMEISLFKKILKLCNWPSDLFFEYLIDFWHW